MKVEEKQKSLLPVKYKEYGVLIEKDIPSLSTVSARVSKMEAKKTTELLANYQRS